MIKHALIILILLHSIAIANQLQGEYRLICVTQSLEKSLDFPSSKKIKVVEDGGKYFLLSEEPLLKVSTGNSSVSCDLKNEIIFSKSNGAFRIILTVVGARHRRKIHNNRLVARRALADLDNSVVLQKK